MFEAPRAVFGAGRRKNCPAGATAAPLPPAQNPRVGHPHDRRVLGQVISFARVSAVLSLKLYLENGGQLEQAQQMAGHESPRTTKLYDRTRDEVTVGEVERIRL